MEFLMGRSLQNAIYNLGLRDNYAEAMRNLGFRLEDLIEQGFVSSALKRCCCSSFCSHFCWRVVFVNTKFEFAQKTTLVWETEVWDVWRRASWTLSPRWIFPRGATGSDTPTGTVFDLNVQWNACLDLVILVFAELNVLMLIYLLIYLLIFHICFAD
jgi:hypothetical protein